MHYTEPLYRPPFEASTPLLQVTRGCSHNACTFCSMYLGQDFAASPLPEVVEDLAELAAWRPDATRIFLEAGDAFALSADRLLTLAELIHAHLPDIDSIACYASIRNVRDKTDDELVALAATGYTDLNIGVESGLDDVLTCMNKGFTREESGHELARLRTAGIGYSLNIINGAAGPARLKEHAAANAALVNEAQPELIFVSPLHVDAGTPLQALVEQGGFEECTLGQYLEEEVAFVRQLELQGCVFFGAHVSNPVPVNAWLPRDKEKLVQLLCEGRDRFSAEELAGHPSKGAEGALR